MRPRWLIATIAASALPACSRVVVSPINAGQISLLAYVTQANTNEVDVVDTSSQSPVGQPIKVGQGPVRAVLFPGGSQDYLYVADKVGNTVSFVNRRTQFDEKDVDAGTDPEDLTFQTIQASDSSNQQYLFVSNPSARTVTRINVATQQADYTYDYSEDAKPDDTGFTPAGIVADPKQNLIFVVSSTTETQSGCTGNCTPIGVVSVLVNTPGGPVTEATSITLTGAVKPYRAVISPDGTSLYVSDQGKAQIFQVPVTGNIAQNPPIVSPTAITNVTGGTSDLAITPDGLNLFVTLPESNGMEQIPTGTMQPNGLVPTGGAQPESLAMSGDGNFMWIGNSGSSTIYYSDLTGSTCQTPKSPCAPQGPIDYSLNSASAQPPGDIVLAPGI